MYAYDGGDGVFEMREAKATADVQWSWERGEREMIRESQVANDHTHDNVHAAQQLPARLSDMHVIVWKQH